jgi:TPR repeat protein
VPGTCSAQLEGRRLVAGVVALLFSCTQSPSPRLESSSARNNQQATERASSASAADFKKVFDEASAGDATAQWLVGRLYADGSAVPKDDQQAALWFARSAEQGFVDAQVDFASALADGRGVARDVAKARRLLMEATRSCSQEGGAEGALFCERAPQSLGLVNFLLAAEDGDTDAQLRIADAYAIGDFFGQNAETAKKWYTRAAANGDPDVQYRVASILSGEMSIGTIPPDFPEAAKWYEAAAEQGHAWAQFALGSLHDQGKLGTASSKVEAAEWFRRSANQGLTAAQFSLGVYFLHGYGVPRDRVQAYKWFSLCASKEPTPGFSPEPVEQARQELDLLEKTMTQAEIADAQRLTREWKATPEKSDSSSDLSP